MENVQMISNFKKEFIAGWFRSQLYGMQGLLAAIEKPENNEWDYIIESLKSAETNLRNLRKFLSE